MPTPLNTVISRIASAFRPWPLLALALLCLQGCMGHDDAPDNPAEGWDGNYYLQIVVGAEASVASRSGDNPNGGAEGDGTVTADDAENAIHNATLILYDKSIAGKAFTADDKVFAVMHFSNFSTVDGAWQSDAVEIPFTLTTELKAKQFYAIIVTNADDMTATFANMTLPRLCNYQFAQAQWNASLNSFVMSSASEFSLKFNDDGDSHTSFDSTTGIYTTTSTITVQRLAARIDFAATLVTDDNYKSSDITLPAEYSFTAGIRYPIYTRNPSTGEDSKNTNEYFLLTDFEVLNSYIGSSYLIKRTADDAQGSSNVAFFGAETKNTSNKATNYVVSPTDNNAAHFGTDAVKVADAVVRPHTYTVGGVSSTAYTVGYVRENTNRSGHYTTLRLKGFIGTVTGSGNWNYSGAKRQTYDIVLRHSDPDGTGETTDIMHYGIVRNNIYRVGISKIVRNSLSSLDVYWYYYDGDKDYKVFVPVPDIDYKIDEGSSPPDD